MLRCFPQNIITPATLLETDHFKVKLAENHEEVEKAQRLRYEVFNIEQGRGLKETDKFGIDFDEFDEYCLHLLVIEKTSRKVVGTYRAHLGSIANSSKGFYSSREYDIRGLYSIADKCIELGRTCVSPDHRSGAVVALLWSGITEILVRAKLKYMLGCVSLNGTDPVLGWAIHTYIAQKYSICDEFPVKPRPGFRLGKPPEAKIRQVLADEPALRKQIPPLFKGYIRLGGRICGDPALDRDFGTIDFFILVDIDRVPERYKHHFNYRDKDA